MVRALVNNFHAPIHVAIPGDVVQFNVVQLLEAAVSIFHAGLPFGEVHLGTDLGGVLNFLENVLLELQENIVVEMCQIEA